MRRLMLWAEQQTAFRYAIKARIFKLLWSLRVWRVCNDMTLELERDYIALNKTKYVNEV